VWPAAPTVARAQLPIPPTRERPALTSKAHEALRSCHDVKLQLVVAAALEQAEQARKTLESARRQSQGLREALESSRQAIAVSRSEERYEERLSRPYVTPLDEKRVPLGLPTAGARWARHEGHPRPRGAEAQSM